MADDKQVLIIDNFGDDLELELNSDSPYNTTTTTLQLPSRFHDDSSRDHYNVKNKVFGPSGGGAGPERKFKRKFELFFNRKSASSISTISSGNFQNEEAGSGGSRAEEECCASSNVILNNLWKWGRKLNLFLLLHWRVILSSGLTMISSSACLISFPLHLKAVTGKKESDGFSACFAIATILLTLFGLSSLGLKTITWASTGSWSVSGGNGGRRGGKKVGGGGRRGGSGSSSSSSHYHPRRLSIYQEEVHILRPVISWKNIGKIGFSVGLSVLSVCSAWEDNKVLCNYQDPFLGLVIVFAIITHAVSRWRHVGFKRAFAMLSIAAGVFVSVDYMLIDEQRCRGHYYAHPPKDIWSWKVHLVWTLAFTVAIWLWTVAMFCLESAIPSPGLKPRDSSASSSSRRDETAAVKMRVLSVKPTSDGQSILNPSQQSSVIQSPVHIMEADPEPDLSSSNRRRSDIYFNSPYSRVSYSVVFNAVFWFHVSAWTFITSFFWTEFIPGFGIGERGSAQDFPSIVWASFYECFHDGWSWLLIIALFIFSQSFTYLVLLIRNSLLAICVSCVGFPIIGIWWSLFQINANLFVWMPVYSGELLCATLGLPLILTGTIYLFKLDVLNRIPVSTT